MSIHAACYLSNVLCTGGRSSDTATTTATTATPTALIQLGPRAHGPTGSMDPPPRTMVPPQATRCTTGNYRPHKATALLVSAALPVSVKPISSSFHSSAHNFLGCAGNLTPLPLSLILPDYGVCEESHPTPPLNHGLAPAAAAQSSAD